MAPGLAALLDCSHAADADAEGEGFGAHIGEVRGAEGGCELLAGEECLDGAGEVLVGAGLVARDECRGEGHDVAAVDVVEPRDGGGAGSENSRTTSRPAGFSTRRNSARALAGSLTLRRPNAMETMSKELSGKSSAVASPC